MRAGWTLVGGVLTASIAGCGALVLSAASADAPSGPPPVTTTTPFIVDDTLDRLQAQAVALDMAGWWARNPTDRPQGQAAPPDAVYVVALAVERDGEGWQVLTSIDMDGTRRCYRWSVSGGRASATPAWVACPPTGQQVAVDGTFLATADPAWAAATGFLGAWLTGSPDAARYLVPGLDLGLPQFAAKRVDFTKVVRAEDGAVLVQATVQWSSTRWESLAFRVELVEREGRLEVTAVKAITPTNPINPTSTVTSPTGLAPRKGE